MYLYRIKESKSAIHVVSPPIPGPVAHIHHTQHNHNIPRTNTIGPRAFLAIALSSVLSSNSTTESEHHTAPAIFSLFSLPEHHSNRLARATEAIPTACGKQPEVLNYPILLLLNLRLDPALPLGNIFLFSI